ncbi:MAG: hypothetical protein HF312_15625 [Ignavibacteria bacterium]|nr:hypothetical protein [Ignavibacteria bacterium]
MAENKCGMLTLDGLAQSVVDLDKSFVVGMLANHKFFNFKTYEDVVLNDQSKYLFLREATKILWSEIAERVRKHPTYQKLKECYERTPDYLGNANNALQWIIKHLEIEIKERQLSMETLAIRAGLSLEEVFQVFTYRLNDVPMRNLIVVANALGYRLEFQKEADK